MSAPTILPLVDTHAHLTGTAFEDLGEVLARADAAGLHRVLCVGVDLESSSAAVGLAQSNPAIFAAVGIHPNTGNPSDDWDAVSALAPHDKVVAIGETGLDYYRNRAAAAEQRQSLDRHIELALALNLPVILHNRQSDSDILAAIRGAGGALRGVLHCFSSDRLVAEEALALGFYLSFAGNVTYASSGALRDVAGWMPADRILIETDSPYLSPIPFRGKRNEPANVLYTFNQLVRCRAIEPALLARQVSDNARNLFAW